MIRWQDKDPGENIVVEFDFGQPITSPIVTVAVANGADPDPGLILVGAPSIDGNFVRQRVRDGLDGVDYFFEAKASAGSDTLTIDAVLPVRERPAVAAFATRYVSEADFERRFGDELGDLVREGHSFGQVENEAASLVDGYLAAKYALPLVTVPPIVQALTADVARYRLWDERAPEEVRRRYEDALAQLRDIARGVITLPPDAAGVPAATSLEFDGYGAERIMTTDTLADF